MFEPFDPSNLRAAFDVWPADRPAPESVDDVLRGALAVTGAEILRGPRALLFILRVADDGASLWKADALPPGVSVEDLVRAIAGQFEPAAHAMAVVQPMRAPGDPTVRGVWGRAMLGDDVVEARGKVEGADGPPEARKVHRWELRHGRATDDRGRWIGVPPTVAIHLPMLDAAEA